MRLSGLSLLLATAAISLAQTAPSAEAIIDQAKTQAAGKRAIWAIFGASW